MKRTGTVVPITKGRPPAKLTIGVVEAVSGPRVFVKLDEEGVVLTADQADELSVDLRTLAIEVRNGGQLQ